MASFEDALLRLKQRLGVATDKGIASALGMSPTAFNDRKARQSFPEDKLRAAAQAHPEWNLDVDYVLTGHSAREGTFEQQMSVLKAASAKAATLALPERDQRFVRDILWGVEMGKEAFLLTTIDDFVRERRAISPMSEEPADVPASAAKRKRARNVG